MLFKELKLKYVQINGILFRLSILPLCTDEKDQYLSSGKTLDYYDLLYGLDFFFYPELSLNRN